MAEHWNGGSGGKGSRPRPYSVSQKEFDSNWDAIFNKKKKTDAEKFDDAIMKNDYVEDDIDPENPDK
jgi:hypothetical protein